MTPLRVIIADDHPVVREGLRGMLTVDDSIEVIAEAADGHEAVDLAVRHGPDVVLMDLRMPRLDGATATKRIAERRGDVRVLILTTYDSDHEIVRGVESGAAGFLLKDTPRQQLVESIRAVANGETVLAPAVAARLYKRAQDRSDDTLTAREIQVLRAVSAGLTNRHIGQELSIGEATVKSHLLKIYSKLGVSDRTSAVMAALSRGLLDPTDPPIGG